MQVTDITKSGCHSEFAEVQIINPQKKIVLSAIFFLFITILKIIKSLKPTFY